jgi:hypothetical protein
MLPNTNKKLGLKVGEHVEIEYIFYNIGKISKEKL